MDLEILLKVFFEEIYFRIRFLDTPLIVFLFRDSSPFFVIIIDFSFLEDVRFFLNKKENMLLTIKPLGVK